MQNDLKYTQIDQDFSIKNTSATPQKFGGRKIINGKVNSMRLKPEMIDFYLPAQQSLEDIQSLGPNENTNDSFRRKKLKTATKIKGRRGSQINIEQIDQSKDSLLPPLSNDSKINFDNHNMKCPQVDILSNRITAASTAQNSNGTPRMSKSLLRGSLGSQGPSPVMASNKAIDGFINMQIQQNFGPGPAKYSKREEIRGRYVTIGNTKRFLNCSQNSNSPGPDIYNPHKKMSDRSYHTAQKNSPNCRFTTEKKHFLPGPITPGPSSYITKMATPQIGDKASVKVPFTTAERFPCERVQTASNLGTYGRVHIKRNSEIPSIVNQNQKFKRPKSIETSSRSPQARTQQAWALAKKPPMPTIGNTKRFLIDEPLSMIPKTPGPSDYTIKRGISNGAKFNVAQKYLNKLQAVPGPSDYNYDTMQCLKRSPVGTIGRGKQRGYFDQKEHSPGPADYQPPITNHQIKNYQKYQIAKFNREKRFASMHADNVVPGPACYFKPGQKI